MSALDDAPGTFALDAPPAILQVLKSPRDLTRETLAGVVTALALVPEVISFSFVSGVDPKVALVSSIVLGLVMSVLGGRPAMITAAAGSIALVIGPMVKAHGTAYILPTLLIAGAVQIAFGLLGMARLTRFIPHAVMTGFVNALGLLIFLAQVPHLVNVPWLVYPLFALTIAIVLLAPRVTTMVPAPLIAIVVVTAIVMMGRLAVPDVGAGGGAMDLGLPGLTPWLAPVSLETLRIIWPTALSVAFVGLLETLLTAKLVDDLTETRSDKMRESWALGVANIAASFYGGIGGCAMIAQTVVNVKIGGGRSRLSTVAAGLVLLALVTVLSGVMARIPLLALAAVMMIAAIKTFDWHSVRLGTLRRMPRSETLVMAATVLVTVLTGNLALGIVTGVFLAIVLFARRAAHVIEIKRTLSNNGQAVSYFVGGPLFFASSHDLVEHFHYSADPDRITIDLSHAQIWDASTVAALDAVETRYRTHGRAIEIVGLNQRSLNLHSRLTGRFPT